MTIEAVRRKSSRAAAREARNELPIGEVDANIFNCPACARPLGVGTKRCPGCSTRLIGGVRANRAAGFVGVGLIAGLVIGVVVMGVVTLVTRPATVAVVGPDPVALPSSAPVASAPVAPAPNPAIPASAISALRQSVLVNERLVADAARLEAALAAASPSSVDIARALRALAATAAFGDRIAPTVGDWPEGAAVSAGLAAFYSAVGGTAREGLAYSLTNDGAYVDAGRSMLTVIDELAELEADARALASTAGVELPETVPASPAP